MSRTVGLFVASLMLLACSGGEAPQSSKGSSATARKDDPKLTQSWKMAAEHSPMSDGDLGATPDELAQALFEQGAPNLSHKAATTCKAAGKLAGAASVALRFSVDDSGKIGKVSGDPSGDAATCMADAFAKEAASVEKLPAGDALLRIKFHPAK